MCNAHVQAAMYAGYLLDRFQHAGLRTTEQPKHVHTCNCNVRPCCGYEAEVMPSWCCCRESGFYSLADMPYLGCLNPARPSLSYVALLHPNQADIVLAGAPTAWLYCLSALPAAEASRLTWRLEPGLCVLRVALGPRVDRAQLSERQVSASRLTLDL